MTRPAEPPVPDQPGAAACPQACIRRRESAGRRGRQPDRPGIAPGSNGAGEGQGRDRAHLQSAGDRDVSAADATSGRPGLGKAGPGIGRVRCSRPRHARHRQFRPYWRQNPSRGMPGDGEVCLDFLQKWGMSAGNPEEVTPDPTCTRQQPAVYAVRFMRLRKGGEDHATGGSTLGDPADAR